MYIFSRFESSNQYKDNNKQYSTVNTKKDNATDRQRQICTTLYDQNKKIK